MLTPEEVAQRRAVWVEASAMVAPIIEKHPLEIVRVGNLMSTAATYTLAEQHLGHISGLADWLLKEHNG